MPSLTRNGGKWTDARFKSFIISILRSGTYRWGPKNAVRKAARVKRGRYLCAGHDRKAHVVPASIPKAKGKGRTNNVFVDHKSPVVPVTGWISFDHYIDSMYCEEMNLQVLCKKCHDLKTKKERQERNG